MLTFLWTGHITHKAGADVGQTYDEWKMFVGETSKRPVKVWNHWEGERHVLFWYQDGSSEVQLAKSTLVSPSKTGAVYLGQI